MDYRPNDHGILSLFIAPLYTGRLIIFLVVDPSFLAGAAATLGFFAAADGLPVRLFFLLHGLAPRHFEFGPLARYCIAGSVPSPYPINRGTRSTEKQQFAAKKVQRAW